MKRNSPWYHIMIVQIPSVKSIRHWTWCAACWPGIKMVENIEKNACFFTPEGILEGYTHHSDNVGTGEDRMGEGWWSFH